MTTISIQLLGDSYQIQEAMNRFLDFNSTDQEFTYV